MADPRDMSDFTRQLFAARAGHQQIAAEIHADPESTGETPQSDQNAPLGSRQEVAARHGIPHLAAELHGNTRAEWEADAAARAAVIDMLGGTLNYPTTEPEQPAEEPKETPTEQPDNWVQRMAEKREQTEANRQDQLNNQAEAEAWQQANEAQVANFAAATKRQREAALIQHIFGDKDDAA